MAFSVEKTIFISKCQHSMKRKLIIGLLLVGVLLAAGLATNSTRADPPNHKQTAAILVVFKGTFGARLPDGRLPQLGLEIDWAQSSVGAPVLPPGYPAAQVIADLTTQGYQYHVIGVNYWLFIK